MLPVDLYIHDGHFAVGILGKFSLIKAQSYSWTSKFSVHIGKAHKHFCESTIYRLEVIRAYRGTVIQLDQVWCSPLFLVVFREEDFVC
jgi:hypothetical protein